MSAPAVESYNHHLPHHHGRLMHSSVATSTVAHPSDLSWQTPHRSIPGIQLQLSSPSSFNNTTQHLDLSKNTTSAQQVRQQHQQDLIGNNIPRSRTSIIGRPVSFVQQPSASHPVFPSHQSDTAKQRLSLYPQHNISQATRPISQVSIPPQSLPLTRASTASSSTSSSTLNSQSMASGAIYSNTMYPSHPPPMNVSRRTPSTSSNASSPHTSVRRSSSSRSSNVSSYVALLRKQKATVWCDRSQAEDPRIMAAQRLAKERAEREVAALPGQSSQAHHLQGSTASVGGAGHPVGAKRTPPNSTAGSFTTGVARKIRHHGAQKATTYAGGNMAGAGVPMRLSATEIDDDEEEGGAGERLGSLRNPMDDMDWDAQFYGAAPIRGLHTRTASGQSRTGLGGGGGPSRTATMDSTMPAGSPLSDDNITPGNSRLKDYFPLQNGVTTTTTSNNNNSTVEEKAKEDELRRRGSVDERAMTLTSGRLFVANPDSDSD